MPSRGGLCGRRASLRLHTERKGRRNDLSCERRARANHAHTRIAFGLEKPRIESLSARVLRSPSIFDSPGAPQSHSWTTSHSCSARPRGERECVEELRGVVRRSRIARRRARRSRHTAKASAPLMAAQLVVVAAVGSLRGRSLSCRCEWTEQAQVRDQVLRVFRTP